MGRRFASNRRSVKHRSCGGTVTTSSSRWDQASAPAPRRSIRGLLLGRLPAIPVCGLDVDRALALSLMTRQTATTRRGLRTRRWWRTTSRTCGQAAPRTAPGNLPIQLVSRLAFEDDQAHGAARGGADALIKRLPASDSRPLHGTRPSITAGGPASTHGPSRSLHSTLARL